MTTAEDKRREQHQHNDEDTDPRDRNGMAEVTCGICGRSWCEKCDPCPSALCHWCHGYGYSNAPIRSRRSRVHQS